MRRLVLIAALVGAGSALAGCASEGGGYGYRSDWRSACERDYDRNRAAATASAAALGAAAGAAIAKNNRAAGAAIGGIAGGVIGSQVSKRDDPCGYGFAGYPSDPRYGTWDDREGDWRR